ncbi:hypothetical protein VDG1235_4818 [Verrucomicrobiia bacterium DG1235]|nr:hypothetical protein VDG1235_4818 [Verrucomicrobiae bacterium DG1235]
MIRLRVKFDTRRRAAFVKGFNETIYRAFRLVVSFSSAYIIS